MIGIYLQYKSFELNSKVDSKAGYLSAVKQALLKQNCSVYFDGVETFGASPNSDDSRISLAFPTTGTATLPDGSTTLYILKILSCAADSNDKAQSVGEALWAATEIAYL